MHTVSLNLLRNFLISTLIPFTAVTYVVVSLFMSQYTKDTYHLVEATASQASRNITTYLEELEYLTLVPYYNKQCELFLRNQVSNEPISTSEMATLSTNFDSIMSFLRYSRSDLNGVFMFAHDRCIYSSISSVLHTSVSVMYPYSEEDWYQQAIFADGRAIVVGPHDPEYLSPSYSEPVISVLREIVSLENREHLCVAKFDINTGVFDHIFSTLELQVDSMVAITDSNGTLIYSSNPNGLPKNSISSESKIVIDGTSWLNFCHPIESYDWTIHILLADSQVQSRSNYIIFSAALLYIIGLFIAILFYRNLSLNIVAAVSRMKTIFSGFNHGDFSQRYTYHSNTELDSLGTSLNHTAEKINDFINREYLQTIRQKEIAMKALQSQIQPHFLFNTLSTFIALNQACAQDKLEDGLFALTDMMHYVLRPVDAVGLMEEIHFIEQYCLLQKLRFQDRFSYQIGIHTDISSVTIPALILQPIIENFFVHVVEPSKDFKHLSLTCTYEKPHIKIVIEDDGDGFCVEDVMKKSNRVGLANIAERLRLFTHKSSMTIESINGHGTKFIIILPGGQP